MCAQICLYLIIYSSFHTTWNTSCRTFWPLAYFYVCISWRQESFFVFFKFHPQLMFSSVSHHLHVIKIISESNLSGAKKIRMCSKHYNSINTLVLNPQPVTSQNFHESSVMYETSSASHKPCNSRLLFYQYINYTDSSLLPT